MKNKKNQMRRKLLSGISIIALTMTVNAAWAQAPSADEVEAAIDEVIVTVERRTQNLQDFAGTAGVLNAEQLKELNLKNIHNLDGILPGVNIANNQGNIEVWIRGIGNSNNTELGNPSAATHVDGVYIPRPKGFAAGFIDIDRVEVNYGPQGTLRGRQSMAGSMDVISIRPGLNAIDGSLEVGMADFDERSVEGVFNWGDDRQAVRLAFSQLEADPLYKNKGPTRSEVGLNDNGPNPREGAASQDNLSYRLSYLFEATEDLSILVTHDKSEEDGTGYTGSNFANPFGEGVRAGRISNPRNVVLRFTDDPVLDVDHEGTKFEVQYESDFGSIELLASQRELSHDYQAATPLSPFYNGVLENLTPDTQPNATLFGQQTVSRPVSEIYDDYSFYNDVTESDSEVYELRFVSNEASSFGLPINYTAGIFAFEEEQRSFLGATSDRSNGNWMGQEFNTRTLSESTAAYIDGTYDLADNMRISAGYRRTEEEIERYGVNGVFSIALGNCWNAHYCADSAAGNTAGTNRPTWFNWWEQAWEDVGTARFGTRGFQFAKFGRTIYNPDTNGDGTLTGDERVAWMLDGVARWGEDDNLDEVFAAGVELKGGWWNPSDANYIGDAALAAHPTLGRCIDANSQVNVSPTDATIMQDLGCLSGSLVGGGGQRLRYLFLRNPLRSYCFAKWAH